MRNTGAEIWAWNEFGGAAVEDERWRRRLAMVAKRVALRPAGTVTEVFGNDAERQGAYGLLESSAVEPEAVGQAMFEACARRAVGEEFVFCPVDGTSLTLADWTGTKGFGPIGTHQAGARGLKVMNAMMLSPAGVPLGVSSQRWWTRPPRSKRRRKHRDLVPPDEKETRHWLDAMKQTRDVMAAHAPGTKCWFQLDREGDAWPMLMEAGLDGHWFTIRCRGQRYVQTPGGRLNIKTALAQQPVRAQYTLSVRGTLKRQAREAVFELRATKVTLDIRDKRTKRRSTLEVNVVQARERGTTPEGEKPIEWTLLTNRPIETVEQLQQVILGYSMRWRIEELHRTWKSGACNVENSQLRSPSAVIKWATILMAAAARIERIKHLSREEPQRPATEEFTPFEIRAAAILHFGKSAKTRAPVGTVPTIADVTLWIAKIGGYTGKSSGGPPGTVVLTRGLEQVRAAAQALEAVAP